MKDNHLWWNDPGFCPVWFPPTINGNILPSNENVFYVKPLLYIDTIQRIKQVNRINSNE